MAITAHSGIDPGRSHSTSILHIHFTVKLNPCSEAWAATALHDRCVKKQGAKV